MALFQTAYSFMMLNEDATQAHVIVSDAPPGAFAISGINSAAFPTQYAAIAALPQNQRGPAVANFYQTIFWNSWFSQLISDAVSMRVFDASVNMGAGAGIIILQKAVNSIGGSLVIDGGWGPNTLDATNACNPVDLVNAFQTVRCEHYEAIVARNPADKKYLTNWLARAKK